MLISRREVSPLRPLCSGAAGQRASRLAERARRKVRREGGKAGRETGDDRGTQSWRVSFTQALALTRQNPVRCRHSHEATRPVPTLGRVLHDNLILRSRFVAPTGSSWLRPQGAGSRVSPPARNPARPPEPRLPPGPGRPRPPRLHPPTLCFPSPECSPHTPGQAYSLPRGDALYSPISGHAGTPFCFSASLRCRLSCEAFLEAPRPREALRALYRLPEIS